MSRFLFTSEWSDDLGLPTRLLPLAKELRRRGHEVAFCNPALVPSRVIEAAGLPNLPVDLDPDNFPDVHNIPRGTSEVWDMDHFAYLAGGFQESLTRAFIDRHLEVMGEYQPDVVVDALNPAACIASRILAKPLVTVIQGDMHPSNSGHIWWKEKPDDLPTALPIFNKILASYGLEPISQTAEFYVGDVTVCVGTPETDPIPEPHDVIHQGPVFDGHFRAELPEWINDFAEDKPLIWVYAGNLRYEHSPWADSIVILRAAFAGLADRDVRVVTTSGHQERCDELPALPANFRYETFLPGLPLAKRSDLMIHHGGHASCLLGGVTGTPALIVPTFSERESTARRMVGLGAARMMLPDEDESGEKHLSAPELWDHVELMLEDETLKAKAGELARKMQGADQLQEAAARVERLVRQNVAR